MKTADEIMRATGITYATFMRLKQLGIVPKSEIHGLGRDKGVMGYYPDEVESIVNWAISEHKRGVSLVGLAKRWHKGEVLKEEILMAKPNPSVSHWAIELYAEALSRHPGDADIFGNIESTQEQDDGSLVVTVKLRKIPRK